MEREQFLLELRSSSELKNAPKIAQRKTMTVDGSAEEEGKKSIRVMQFNTLARALSTPEVGKFEMLEEGALDWPFRRARGAIQWQIVVCHIQGVKFVCYVKIQLTLYCEIITEFNCEIISPGHISDNSKTK